MKSMLHNTTTVESILFFDFFTIFCEPVLKLEGDSGGGGGRNPPAAAGFWAFFLPRQRRWHENFEIFLVPVRGMNWDQRGTLWSRFVPRTGTVAPLVPRGRIEGIRPGSCHEPGPLLRNEPGRLPRPDEPGPLTGIGPDWAFELGRMAFGGWTKAPFSTSD